MNNNNNNAPQQRRVPLEVFTITERESPDGPKSWWTRVGSAFINRDGSMNVILDALPLNGRLQIRQPQERPDNDSPRGNAGNGGSRRGAF